MKKEETATAILTFLVIFGVFYGIFKIEQYKFRDCKKVGHTTFYCLLNAGK